MQPTLTFALAGAALLASVGGAIAATPAEPAFLVIAHRGASGERPEHTRSAYEQAIAEGADFIEPDLVATRDGVLVARHENEISGTTDVADHPEFADRKRTKTIDGEVLTGFFTEDFTLAELKTLRARERLPELRPANVAFDGKDEILTFAEVVAIARNASIRGGRTVGVYPEMKHPSYFRLIGLPLEARLARDLKAEGLDRADAPVFVQCFEPSALMRIGRMTRARRILLMSAEGGPADGLFGPGGYSAMLTDAGLRDIAKLAQGVGIEKSLLLPRGADDRELPATDLARRAHAAGLKVHVWTFRAENYFLAPERRRGEASAPDYLRRRGDLAGEIAAARAAGADGVFSDFPGIAAAVRDGVDQSAAN